MALYETLPSDFSDDQIAHIEVTHSGASSNGASTQYEITDPETGATFFVIQEHTSTDRQSEYFRVVQRKGEQHIFSPATVETRGYSKDPSYLAQRAVLTAMREFDSAVNRLH